MPEELPRLLTADEVAAYLRVSQRWVYEQLRHGRLPAVQICRQWRVRQADLDAFVESFVLTPSGDGCA